MKNFIKTVVSFVAGAAMGGVVAYELAKRKFASRIEAEIESIKNMYKEFDNQTKAYSAKNKPDIDVIVKAIDNEDTDKVEKKSKTGKKNDTPKNESEYTNYSAYYAPDETQTEAVPEVKKPYVISADDYGATDYKCKSLIYYADGALTEEGSDVKLPVKKTIGSNTKRFDERGMMYIRDDEREIDYEVIKEKSTYAQYHSDGNDNDE